MVTGFEEQLFSESVGILSILSQVSPSVLIIKMHEDRGLETAWLSATTLTALISRKFVPTGGPHT